MNLYNFRKLSYCVYEYCPDANAMMNFEIFNLKLILVDVVKVDDLVALT